MLGEGVAELGGRLDIVAANAAIISWPQDTWASTSTEFRELDRRDPDRHVHHRQGGGPAHDRGGQRRLDRADLLRRGDHRGQGLGDYKAAKNGVLALKDTLAYELAEHFIRVNAICPTAVDTPMIQNETPAPRLPAGPGRTRAGGRQGGFAEMNLLPIPWVDPVDVSNAIVWLASDAARYVTGVTLPVDAGNHLKC